MNYANLQWRDGQPYNPDFEDVYFSADNGIEETEHVFIHHNKLYSRFAELERDTFVIAETGFGSGLNFLVAVKHWLELSDAQQTLYFYSIENHPFTLDDIIKAQQFWPELSEIAEVFQQQYMIASDGFHLFDYFNHRVKLVLMIGEVQTLLPQMQARVDAWFLDGFAPGRNPDMWDETVLSEIQRLSQPGTTLSTYTAAGYVRRGLIEAGFDMQKVSGTGNKRHMLSGVYTAQISNRLHSLQPWFEFEMKAPLTKTATIIGAGIAGLTTAWALIKRGYRVEILEAGCEAGARASGNPQGMLMPRLSLQDSADAEFYTSAYFYALRCLNLLDEKQNCWKQTGGIQLPSSERVKKQIAHYPENKLLAQVLNASEASEKCGLKIDSAVHYFSQAACVFPKKLLQALISTMGEALHIRYNTNVDKISRIDNQWHLFSSENKILKKTSTLILANAWQIKEFDIVKHIDMQAARGQLSFYRANEKSLGLKMPLSFEGYLMPESDQQHVSGASFKLGDTSTALSDEEFQHNVNDIKKWFNDLFNIEDILGGRVSARAVTVDRTPVVGGVADYELSLQQYADLYKALPAHRYPVSNHLPGLFVNSGHGARGLTSAFISAEILAAMLCDEPLPVSNRVRYALHPSRFLIRALKKRKI